MKYPYLSLLDRLIRGERSNTVGRGLDEAHEVSWIKFSEVQRRSRYSNLLEETQLARVWVEDNLRRCKMGACTHTIVVIRYGVVSAWKKLLQG